MNYSPKKIISIGGGIAGLFSSILLKKNFPTTDVLVYERNKNNFAQGFGVVLAESLLEKIKVEDIKIWQAINKILCHWRSVNININGMSNQRDTLETSSISREKLLEILSERAIELGVNIQYDTELKSYKDIENADLVLVSDGANSVIRSELTQEFKTHIEYGRNKYIWLGTHKVFDRFNFIFREHKGFVWRAHCYPYQDNLSTVVIECTEAAYEYFKLGSKNIEASIQLLENIFKADLDDHHLLHKRSRWASFPTITNKHWHFKNMVLLGDALHTAHFSIGSGSKLALEDAISLCHAIKSTVSDGKALASAFETYRRQREAAIKLKQSVAASSQFWFEDVEIILNQLSITEFTNSLFNRSKYLEQFITTF